MADTPADIKLRKALKMVCQERLLPNLISSMSQQLSTNIKLEYRSVVLGKYKQELRIPRHYHPEEGKTKRELFQEKLQKIINHEIPIDYCGVMVNSEGKKVASYRGQPLDKVPVETKEEFKVFKDFSYDNFIKDKLNVVWDEHAEYKNESSLRNPYEVQRMVDKRNRIHTVDQNPEESKRAKLSNQEKTKTEHRSQSKIEREKAPSQLKLPLISIPSVRLKSKPKILTGRVLSKDENKEIGEKFRIIGGYNKLTNQSNFVTKESIVKYLKRFIYKPIRIIDFLEIKPVESLESYILLVKRIKTMPKKHRNFLCFLFFDTNNDAIICQNDLLRLRSLGRNLNYLESDYQKLIKTKYQQKMEIPPQFDLYRLPEVTQTSYFNFLQKSPIRRSDIQFDKLITEETFQGDSVLLTYKKRFRIDFEKFQKVYKDSKPGLWYLLMDLLGGIRYEGVSYFS